MKPKKNPSHELGLYLAALRRERGLTQWEMAKKLQYSSGQFISNFERGRATPPLARMQRIAKILRADKARIVDLLMQAKREEVERVLRG